MSSLEDRISNLERIIIIIIGGGGGIHIPPKGDPAAEDTKRVAELLRVIPRGDPPPIDIGRLTLEEAENRLNEISAAISRFQAQHGELQARIKQLRGG